MKYFLNFFDRICDLRIHVAFSSFLFASWFLYLLNIPSNIAIMCGTIIFFYMLFGYLFNRFSDYDYDVIVDNYFKKPQKEIYFVLSIISLNVAIFLFFFFKEELGFSYPTILILIFLIIFVSTTYSIKTFFKYPFKNYLIIKNLYSVGSKFFGIAAFAVLLSPFPISLILTMSIGGICLNLINSILWDIRDMKSDKAGKVTTIPLTIGRMRAIILCLFILMFGFLFVTLFGTLSHSFIIRYSIVLFFIISVIKANHPRWFHLMVIVYIMLNLGFSNQELRTLLDNPNTVLCKYE